MNNFQDFIARKRREFGKKFDASNLDPRFAPYLGSQTRIKVETCGIVKTGTIGVTTGWRACIFADGEFSQHREPLGFGSG